MLAYFGPILIATAFALLHHWRMLRTSRIFLAVFVLVTALISGLRFEVGQDWPAYDQFFQNVDIGAGPIESFVNHDFLPKFEYGYHQLNYIVKLAGGSYHVVLLIASLFCSYSIYRLITGVHANRYYILSMYFSYSYLILQFAQVRQSLAIGVLLLSCTYFARSQRKLLAIAIASTGVLFQYSALMYVAIFALALYWPERWGPRVVVLMLVLFGLPLLVFRDHINFYSVLAGVAFADFAQDKIAVYEIFQEELGVGVLFIAAYLLVVSIYLSKCIDAIKIEHRFIARFAISATLATVLFVVIFPNSYVMFSRAYVMASILQATAVSMVLEKRSGNIHSLIIVGSLVFAITYCVRVLTFNSDEYLPYRTFLFSQ